MCVGVSDRLIVVRTRKIILKIVEGSHNFQDFSINSVKFVVFFFSLNIAEGVGFFVCFKVQGVGLVWDHACTIHGLLRLLYRSVFRQF